VVSCLGGAGTEALETVIGFSNNSGWGSLCFLFMTQDFFGSGFIGGILSVDNRTKSSSPYLEYHFHCPTKTFCNLSHNGNGPTDAKRFNISSPVKILWRQIEANHWSSFPYQK